MVYSCAVNGLVGDGLGVNGLVGDGLGQECGASHVVQVLAKNGPPGLSQRVQLEGSFTAQVEAFL